MSVRTVSTSPINGRRPPHPRGRRGFTLVEVMIVTVISAFVFAGVLSAYIFLGRALTRQGNAEQLESRGRLALYDFTQDMSGSSAVTSASSSQITVSTWIQQASGTPVLATAQYTYSSVNAQLTLVRTSPVSPS